MNRFFHNLFATLSLLLVSACLLQEDPKPTSSNLLVQTGDLVVVSFTNDTLVVFDSKGNLKRTLYTLANTAESITGITWLSSSNEILISIDGGTDRIEAISIIDGTSRYFYLNTTYYTGTLLGIGEINGDIVANETATLERFNSNGIRKTGTAWPGAVPSVQKAMTLANGDWLSCSSTAGLRVNPDSMTSIAATSSLASQGGIAASWGCGQLSNGRIVASWNGASDYVYSYNETLADPVALVDNVASTLSDPRGVGIGPDDEIYVADATGNKIVQLDADGEVIRVFGTNVLQGPRHVLVVPEFN